MYLLKNCPTNRGHTTVMDNWATIKRNGTPEDDPRNTSSRKGVTNIPRKLPNAELKIAAASFPPTAFVSITADETGGGIHPTTNSPFSSHSFKLVNCKILTISDIKPGTKASVKLWTNTCNRTLLRALFNSSVFNDKPLFKKIVDTATYLTVISGFKIPPLAPMNGAILAKLITTTIPIKNQFFCSLASIFIVIFRLTTMFYRHPPFWTNLCNATDNATCNSTSYILGGGEHWERGRVATQKRTALFFLSFLRTHRLCTDIHRLHIFSLEAA